MILFVVVNRLVGDQFQRLACHRGDQLGVGEDRRIALLAEFARRHCLAPGGRLVFNIFLPREAYLPDSAANSNTPLS